MSAPISRIWTTSAPDDHPKLQACINGGCNRSKGTVKVYFRADDVGVPSRNFTRLLELFRDHGMPLALAVVPAWMTASRWMQLQSAADSHPGLWCWHQHGWRHANHAPAGKKSEFGLNRTDAEILSDIKRGRERLGQILGDRFCPVFTPPWNRCDRRTLAIIHDLGFQAVSRSAGDSTAPPHGLPDLCVHIDLHTRKGRDPAADRAQLLREIEQALAGGCCGFMLHHQRMNGPAFRFLEVLLTVLREQPQVEGIGFQKMV